MCEPVTIASIAVTAVSTALSMYDQNQQQKYAAKSASETAKYNAQLAANEEASRRQLAQNEIAKGAAERDRHLRSGTRQMGQMRSQLASGGFDIASGSNLSLLSESAEEIQHEASLIDQNAAQAAWQHQAAAVNASNNQAWANYQKSQANSGRQSSLLGMGDTLLGGIGKGLNIYQSMPKKTA